MFLDFFFFYCDLRLRILLFWNVSFVNTINQLELVDIYRICYQKIAETMLVLSVQRTLRTCSAL